MKKYSAILKFILLTFSILISCFSYAQEGSPFVTNYPLADESMSENFNLCIDKDGVLIAANRKGLLVYDAEEWKLIKTPELPIVVASDPNSGFVYVGCRNQIGYLDKNKTGDYQYIVLAGKDAGIVTQIIFVDKQVYFISETAITTIDGEDITKISAIKSETNSPFLFGMNLNDRLIVDVAGKGLQTLDDIGFNPFLPKFQLSGKLLFSASYDSTSLILGTSENKCYLFNGKQIKPIALQDQQYLNDANIVDGKELDSKRIVISTSNAGCLVFEKSTGKTVYTINFQSGLPDDEVLALGTDPNQGIWMAHYYGLTRVDAKIPVKNYSYYKDLLGKPQTIEFFNGKLFVGTSSGVYYLKNKSDYVEFTSKSVKELAQTPELPTSIMPKEPEIQTKSATPAAPVVAENKEQKRGLFSRLFSKSKPTETTPTAIVQPVAESENKNGFFDFSSNVPPKKEKVLTVQKTYKLSSVKYVYTKVPGFDFKCRQLYLVGDKLIALTANGIYDINETKAQLIIPNVSGNYLYYNKVENKLYICTDNGIYTAKFQNGKWETDIFPAKINEPAYSFAKDIFDNYWIGGESKAFRVKLKQGKTVKEIKEYLFNNEYRERVIVRISDKKPIFFLSSGIYSIFNDSIQSNLWLSKFSGTDSRLYFSHNDNTWLQNKNEWIVLNAFSSPDSITPQYLNLFADINQIYIDKQSNVWVIEDNSSIFKVDQKGIANYHSDLNAFIKRFTSNSGESLALTNLVLDNTNNSLIVRISAPYFLKPNSNQYQIFIKGLYHDWGNWTSNPEFSLTLPSGNWDVRVRARNIFGNISEEKVLNFYIERPFYTTWWFILICIAVLVSLIAAFVKIRERALRMEKEILEQKVVERTKQIAEQKEEIEEQRNKIAYQNREITDSIKYAKRIQTAVMPDTKILDQLLGQSFILFRPKDIVSGDFFWAKKKNDKIIVAAADCTGHGVPGGFLSMLGISILNEISAMEKEFQAHEILNLLRERIKSTLIKEGYEDQSKDGMDICLLVIDQKNHKLQYAGANNSLYLIRNKEITEYDADKMPIGAYIDEKESFTLHNVELQTNDRLYLFSDGYRDQIGGPKEKRLKTQGFRNILLDIQGDSMPTQKSKLEMQFEDWKGENDQMDDIMVMGIQVK